MLGEHQTTVEIDPTRNHDGRSSYSNPTIYDGLHEFQKWYCSVTVGFFDHLAPDMTDLLRRELALDK